MFEHEFSKDTSRRKKFYSLDLEILFKGKDVH